MRVRLALLVLLVAVGCAKRVYLTSVPPGAVVLYRDQPMGVTPTMLHVPREGMDDPVRVRFELPGYAPATLELQERVSVRRIFGSIFSLGLPVMLNGFTRFVEVGPVMLAPLAATNPPAGSDLQARLQKLEDLRAQGLIDDKEYRDTRGELLRRDLLNTK